MNQKPTPDPLSLEERALVVALNSGQCNSRQGSALLVQQARDGRLPLTAAVLSELDFTALTDLYQILRKAQEGLLADLKAAQSPQLNESTKLVADQTPSLIMFDDGETEEEQLVDLAAARSEVDRTYQLLNSLRSHLAPPGKKPSGFR